MLSVVVMDPHEMKSDFSAEMAKMVFSVAGGREWTTIKVETTSGLQRPWLALRTHHVGRSAILP